VGFNYLKITFALTLLKLQQLFPVKVAFLQQDVKNKKHSKSGNNW